MTDLKPITQELAEVLQHLRKVIDEKPGDSVYFGTRTMVKVDAALEHYNDYLTTEETVDTANQWARVLSDFIDQLGGDSPALWQWSDVTPTPEKVVECLRELVDFHMTIAADNELDACVEWIEEQLCMPEKAREDIITKLRSARRPQPTLKEQALKDFETIKKNSDVLPEILETVERALKTIPE